MGFFTWYLVVVLLGGFLTEITYVQITYMVVFHVKKDKCFPSFKVSCNRRKLRDKKKIEEKGNRFLFKEK